MHIVTRGLSVALISLSAAAAGATSYDEATSYALRVRRVFPDILRRSANSSINLSNLAERRRQLIRALGPLKTEPAHGPQTIRIERSEEQITREITPERSSLIELRETFGQIVRAEGKDSARLRPRILERISNLAELLSKLDHDPLNRVHNQTLRTSLLDLLRFAIWSQWVPDLRRRLDEFGIDDLGVFHNPEEFKARWKTLFEELGVQRRRDRPLYRALHKLRDPTWRQAVRHRREDHRMAPAVLTLAELPADVALAKGFIAGDCSSLECFGYPLSACERVFAILDAHDEYLGVVAVTRVNVAAAPPNEAPRPAVFVNTVSGPELDANLTLMILRGLAEWAGPGQVLALPVAAQLAKNFNFTDVREVLEGLITHVEPTRLTFLDPDARHVIERFSFHPYDAMAQNRFAHPVPADRLVARAANVVVEVTEGSRFGGAAQAELGPDDLPRAVIEATAAGRRDVARALWVRAGGDAAEVEGIVDDLSNVRGEPVPAFERRARETITRLGLNSELIDLLIGHSDLFERGRLVAAETDPDPETFGRRVTAIVRYLTRHRQDLQTPEMVAWFKRLTLEQREFVLGYLLRAQDDHFRGRRDEAVFKDLFAMVIDLPTFRARALALHLTDLSWRTLIYVARSLASFNAPPIEEEFEATTAMIAALHAAVTPAEFVTTALELVATQPNLSSVANALGRSMDRLTALTPTPQQLNRLGSPFTPPPLLHDLRAWTAAGPEPSAESFLASVRGFGTPHGAVRSTLIQSTVFSRLSQFLSFDPPPALIGELRVRAMRPDSAEDRWLVLEAIDRHVRHLGDLLPLVRTDVGPEGDVALIAKGLARLERLSMLYDRLPASDKTLVTSSARLGPLWEHLRRHRALMRTTHPATFFARLMENPVSYPAHAPNGGLTERQLDHFIALRPTVAEFRALIELTGEIEGYGVKGAALVRDRTELAEMVRPLTLPRVSLKTIRGEFTDLISRVARRPTAAQFLSESVLDEITVQAGLDRFRPELPRISCARALGSP